MTRKLNKISGALLIMLLTVFLISPCAANEKDEADLAYQAAVAGLPSMLKGIESRAPQYGFTDKKDMDKVFVGKTALVMYTLDENMKVVFTDSLMFPVFAGATPSAVLIVHKLNGEYKAGAIGGAEFAREIAPLTAVKTVREGLAFINVLRCYHVGGDFRITGDVNLPNPDLVPFKSGESAVDNLSVKKASEGAKVFNLESLIALIDSQNGE